MSSDIQHLDSPAPSPAPEPDPPFSLKSALLMGILVIFVIPVAFFLPVLIGKSLEWQFIEDSGVLKENFGIFILLTQSVGLAITLAIIRKRLKKLGLSWSSIGLRKFRLFQAARYIAGFYLLMVAGILVLAAVAASMGIEPPHAGTNETGGTKMLESMGSFWMTFILSVIFAPIIEEILFRGILFSSIKKRYGVVAGVILSGVLFGMAHLNPLSIIAIIPMGIYLAIMYNRTKSIYPGIILHASWNFMVLMIAQVAATG